MLGKLAGRLSDYLRKRGLRDSVLFLLSLGIQLMRGLWHGYWLVFIGRHVVIRGCRQVRIGRFTRIEDYCELDGFGSGGLNIGTYCKVGRYSILRVPPVPFERGACIRIGDATTFAEFCFVGGAGTVEIGARNAFGQYVSIHPQNHEPYSAAGARTSSQGIRIGDDNWIGAKATILDGATIGARTIVAAGAVVRNDIGSDVMAAGVPALVKRRLAP
jgi:acetyltransferase-like isoleucine patch superfamily enzyme